MSSLVQVSKLLRPKHLESVVSPTAVDWGVLRSLQATLLFFLGALSSLSPPPLFQLQLSGLGVGSGGGGCCCGEGSPAPSSWAAPPPGPLFGPLPPPPPAPSVFPSGEMIILYGTGGGRSRSRRMGRARGPRRQPEQQTPQ